MVFSLILATDFFTVETIRPKTIYVLFDPASAAGGRQRAARLGVGHPASQEAGHRRAAFGCSVPPSRPGRHVLGTVG